MREMKNAYEMLVEEPDGKKRRRRCKHRYKDNIKTDLKKVGCLGVN